AWGVPQPAPVNGAARAAIAMSGDVAVATDELREYLFENVYLWEERLSEAARARRVIEFLWSYFMSHPEALGEAEYTRPEDSLARRVADCVRGVRGHCAMAAAGGLGFIG